MLLILTTGVNFNNILQAAFSFINVMRVQLFGTCSWSLYLWQMEID